MKLKRNDLKLTNATLRDGTRPSLSVLAIADGFIVAADGFTMVVREKKREEGDGFPENYSFGLPSAILDRIKLDKFDTLDIKLMPDGDLSATRLNKSGKIVEPSFRFKPWIGDVKFNTFYSLAPKNDETRTKVDVSASLLRQLLKVIPDGQQSIQLAISNDPNPMAGNPVEYQVLGNDGETTRGLMMPMCLAGGEIKWLKDVFVSPVPASVPASLACEHCKGTGFLDEAKVIGCCFCHGTGKAIEPLKENSPCEKI
jgi:hypothetical protein